MGLFEYFFCAANRRFATPQALADFIDEQAAFLVQKGIYDYSRARSGHFSKVMLADQGFSEPAQSLALAGISARSCDGG